MVIKTGNLLERVPTDLPNEEITTIAELSGARIERIVSTGQASPPGFWYDQAWVEWIIVLSGSAGLLIEGEEHPHVLRHGDFVEIPPHLRHRVEWTDVSQPTVWLAIHSGRPGD
jgi:cupin 2 domain-containing protein